MRTAVLIAALVLPLSAHAQTAYAQTAHAQTAHAQAQTSAAPLAAYACGGCHGVGAKGEGAVVALAGRPKQELVAAMAAFRSNERPGTIMGRIARGYTEAEIEAIAAHLSAQR